MYKLIDTHVHLDFAAFDEDREQLLEALPTKGVVKLINPAVSHENWQRVLDLADTAECVHPALGIHPMFLDTAQKSHIDDLKALLQAHRDKVVAVGECGLDMTQDNIDDQRFYFTEQLKLAQEFDLPVIVHHRKSHHLTVPFLKKYRPAKGGVIHAFSGSYEQAMQYIDLGFKLGIGGTITYDRAEKTRDTLTRVPVESLVLETDAPDMPIHGRQGKRNSPAYLSEIFIVLSLLTEISGPELEQQLMTNSTQLFGLELTG